ncbi:MULTISPECIES: lysylphosphatidylglycerol synthase domain-containing protein [unclassified Cupriavidus]|uniref:lysylphosphatidylglycerol synthase domain-containing protein n=1 Tax=unclassified Cupriavidus TaxID=2640874 RepID=UPI001C000B08|nr:MULTISPECIES: lysylphosphatidylglycerol synthase domain-containing protein [unclassified Cupriavidus]MCA3189267.1 flippase-like domain-containing protein [Cupriavidus sp.]MCA3195347.1 flippase-like domain-containing protein [Cupriavidus sp.]MCA3200902.1 flippase-like domain-containing protein [Cupriavidus sp.]MCA3206516.1 flippase-like domain-containing protein [Cupriavidus sp.]MCA3235131.1 flippase-like domain-containing protein [Cupriavidus sp.]
MNRAAFILLSAGAALFVGLLAWQGFGAVTTTLMSAGWGLAVVAAFHLVPLALDAGAIAVLLDRKTRHGSFCSALKARWTGESVNSLLPAGQIGGPVLMVRYLSHRGARMRDAAAAITVSTTTQALSQMLFALLGIAVFGANDDMSEYRTPIIAVTVVLGACVLGFCVLQRRGMFGRMMRLGQKLFGKRPEATDAAIGDGHGNSDGNNAKTGRWAGLALRADAVDSAIRELYRDRKKVAASFALNLLGWIAGTGEVWLILHFLGHPVNWHEALLLESVGQAIRGAAFAIPGSLGAQEGGYLLLAPLVGLPPDAALALSLAKRVRELVLGIPGLVYLHFSERKFQRRRAAHALSADRG